MNDAMAEPAKPMALPEAAPEGGIRRAPLWLLALVTFSGTLAMHIFVPALPVAAQDLQAGIGEVRMTISLYIFGLAVGQLVYGPISDRIGRRTTLMAGLALYTVAGFAAFLAPSVEWLITARLFQALGGCAGLVLGRAIVRDTSAPNEAARRLALMNLMVTLGPGMAPIIGAALATSFGWRSIFAILCCLGLINLLLSWRLLPETGQVGQGVSTAALMRNYLGLLKSPVFLGFSIGGGCATTSFYAFVASAPFIFIQQLHRPPHEVAWSLGLMVFGVSVGSLLATRLMLRVSLRRLLVMANGGSVLASFVLLGAVLTGNLTMPLAVAAMFVFTLGVGIASPSALTQAISVNPKVIGSASGLYGFAQMAVGAICTILAGIGPDPALAAALVLAGAGIISQVSFWIALRGQART